MRVGKVLILRELGFDQIGRCPTVLSKRLPSLSFRIGPILFTDSKSGCRSGTRRKRLWHRYPPRVRVPGSLPGSNGMWWYERGNVRSVDANVGSVAVIVVAPVGRKTDWRRC